jgi:hypothetical protein
MFQFGNPLLWSEIIWTIVVRPNRFLTMDHGILGYPRITWVPMDSMVTREPMRSHGIWPFMQSMGTHGTHGTHGIHGTHVYTLTPRLPIEYNRLHGDPLSNPWVPMESTGTHGVHGTHDVHPWVSTQSNIPRECKANIQICCNFKNPRHRTNVAALCVVLGQQLVCSKC